VFARAGEAVDLLAVFEADWDTICFCEADDSFYAVSVAAAGDHDAVEGPAGSQGFFHGVKSG
jgi:hypothetical protein